MNKKLKIILVIIAGVLLVAGIVVWYLLVQKPHNIAVNDYNKAISVIEAKNAELDGAIAKLQALIDSGEKPLDDTIINTSKEVIKNAQVEKVLIEEMPKKTDDIIAKTLEILKPLDYSKIIKQLSDKYTSLDESIKQYKQFINPSEAFVIQRLYTVDEIKYVKAVTEDNDPNGQLNKPGGYTATVYFESSNVDQNEVYGADLIEKGTDAGGAIEVYATEEDAHKRNNYLATFDGTVLASGSHIVVGTVVIRTSNELTASKQKALEAKIISALAALSLSKEIDPEIAYWDSIDVNNFTFFVSEHWVKYANDGDQYPTYYAGLNGNQAVAEMDILYSFETDKNYDVSFEGLYADRENMSDAVAGFLSNGKIIGYEVFESNFGLKGLLYHFSYNVGYEGDGYCFCFPSEEDRAWFYVVYLQPKNQSAETYKKDFMTMIAHIIEK